MEVLARTADRLSDGTCVRGAVVRCCLRRVFGGRQCAAGTPALVCPCLSVFLFPQLQACLLVPANVHPGMFQTPLILLDCSFTVLRFFFLMWTTFKVFIEFVAAWLLVFYVLAFWPRGMWDLSSPTKDQKHICRVGRQSANLWTRGKAPLDSFTSSPPCRQPLPVPPPSEPSLCPLSSALGKDASKPRTSISSSLFLTSSVGHRLSDPTASFVAASSLSEFL